jgi:DNA-binding IclR family transcriptional regulator
MEEQDKSVPGRASADRLLAILSCFQRGDEALTLAEITRRTGLIKSTVLRMAGSLLDSRFLLRDPHGNYRLGPEISRLNLIYHEGLRVENFVIPVLQSLVEQTGETASIYIRHGSYRLCQYRVNSPHQLGVHKQPGEVRPMDDASSAVVLRSFGENGDHHVALKLPLFTEGASDPYAASLAIPVYQSEGALLGALVLAGPCNRLTAERAEEYSDAMRSAALSLSRQLGGETAFLRALQPPA